MSIITTIIITLIYNFIGFYTIQPIGALPQGITVVVLKNPNDPFFNSPDAVSIRRIGGVSLFSRAQALSEGIKYPILLRLPYIPLFYDISIYDSKNNPIKGV